MRGVWCSVAVCACMYVSGVYGCVHSLRNTSIIIRKYVMRKNWMTKLERQYVQTLLDEAIEHINMRHMKLCAAYVQHAIQSRHMSTLTLRPDVINTFAKD